MPSTLVDAFKGVEVVISTIPFSALETQKPLARAAKEAGVKIFVPSEYGGQSHKGGDHFIYQAKKATQDYLREINLPYTLLYTGPMPGMFLIPYASTPPLPVWALVPNPMSLATSSGILPVGRSLMAPETNP